MYKYFDLILCLPQTFSTTSKQCVLDNKAFLYFENFWSSYYELDCWGVATGTLTCGKCEIRRGPLGPRFRVAATRSTLGRKHWRVMLGRSTGTKYQGVNTVVQCQA
jgi:hypothetical protein